MRIKSCKLTFFPLDFLLALTIAVIIHTDSFAFDTARIFFAGDSGATYCRQSSGGADLYQQSLFGRLQASPPPGYIIEPQQSILGRDPCSLSNPDGSGYGGLKILDWNTACTDASGNGICGWSCYDCPDPDCEINRNALQFGGEADWCCCASRQSCIDQSDAAYVILNVINNDLFQLFKFYGRDVDMVVEEAKTLTNYLTGQGRTVIWLSYYPIGYGSLGRGESACSDTLSCLFAANSNAEYFFERFIPWISGQSNVYLIDFFNYIKETYAPDPLSFIDTYGYDGIHLTPAGHQIYYDYVYPQLTALLSAINDRDEDGIPDESDNCPETANPDQADMDTDAIGDVCDPDDDNDGISDQEDNCSCVQNPGQEDSYPPQGNGIGDACDCEGDFNCDSDVDGTDASDFKTDFGRSSILNPCTTEAPCNGDFNCDNDCDGTDASKFKSDFGRSQILNPCPVCKVGPWCVYP